MALYLQLALILATSCLQDVIAFRMKRTTARANGNATVAAAKFQIGSSDPAKCPPGTLQVTKDLQRCKQAAVALGFPQGPMPIASYATACWYAHGRVHMGGSRPCASCSPVCMEMKSRQSKESALQVKSSCDIGGTTLWGAELLLKQIISRHTSTNDPFMSEETVELSKGNEQCAGPVKTVVSSSLRGLSNAKLDSMTCLSSRCVGSNWFGCYRYDLELEVNLAVGDSVTVDSSAQVSCGSTSIVSTSALTMEAIKPAGKAQVQLEFQYVPPEATTPQFKNLVVNWSSENLNCKFDGNTDLSDLLCSGIQAAQRKVINDGVQKVIDDAIKDPLR